MTPPKMLYKEISKFYILVFVHVQTFISKHRIKLMGCISVSASWHVPALRNTCVQTPISVSTRDTASLSWNALVKSTVSAASEESFLMALTASSDIKTSTCRVGPICWWHWMELDEIESAVCPAPSEVSLKL